MPHSLPIAQIDGRRWFVDDRRGELRNVDDPQERRELPPLPVHKEQEVPFDDPASCCRFQPSSEKPFLTTPAALDAYGEIVVLACLSHLQRLADQHDGLDYLQVFRDGSKAEPLWFIEDGDGGAITALMPSDY